jgi:hypothetical protein
MNILEQEKLLEDGEYMVEKVRKHWIVYVENFILHAFGCFIFLVAAHYVATSGPFQNLFPQGSAYGAMTLVMFVLIFWTSFFFAWTKDYFDVWHVTNEHIIAINQKEIFEREESFMELERIQDVFFERSGILGTALNFGILRVQSAGTEQQFVMEYVADVETKAHKIMEFRDKAQGEVAVPVSVVPAEVQPVLNN